MITLRYIFVTLIFSVLVVNLFAQGSMMIQGGGAVTVNGNLIITPTGFVCGNPLTDSRDGKSYSTVLIGTQCWMAQNLNYGVRIDGVAEQTNNNIPEKYCYDNLESNCEVYGGLYQWNEAMQYSTTEGVQGICPSGWHLPSDAEWSTLTNYLGGESIAGGMMKEAGTTHWASPNSGATNSSGFTGLPGGYRYIYGGFHNLSYYPFFWSSSLYYDVTIAWSRGLLYDIEAVFRINHMGITNGFSIRCIKD